MQDFTNKKILLGISGGIAAYKSAYLVRELTKLGAEVRVVMTDSAQAFISPMSLQALSGHEVRSELFDAQAERGMGHIELARWADYLLIAPASANCIAKMAHGLADDLLSTLYLVNEAPVVICPAMNRSMWAHRATQLNCETLIERDVIIVGPEEGSQACGEHGFGRMSEVETIINALRVLAVKPLLKGKKVMITAGPTREAIDPVRYLTNRSSGKMGYALAQAARQAGALVTLISGPVTLSPPEGVKLYAVETAEQMHQAVMNNLEQGMIFIGTAAVADFRVKQASTQKIKKQNMKNYTLELEPNPDILADVSTSGKPSYVAGFAAETNDLLQNARKKMENKQLDMIIANQVGSNQGFDKDTNEVIILTKDNKKTVIPLEHKARIAGQIIAILAGSLQNSPPLQKI